MLPYHHHDHSDTLRVWKYVIPVGPYTTTLGIPTPYRPLRVECVRDDAVAFWAEVDPDKNPVENHEFKVYGTGHIHNPEKCHAYVGTGLWGDLVWHLYELIDPDVVDRFAEEQALLWSESVGAEILGVGWLQIGEDIDDADA